MGGCRQGPIARIRQNRQASMCQSSYNTGVESCSMPSYGSYSSSSSPVASQNRTSSQQCSQGRQSYPTPSVSEHLIENETGQDLIIHPMDNETKQLARQAKAMGIEIHLTKCDPALNGKVEFQLNKAVTAEKHSQDSQGRTIIEKTPEIETLKTINLQKTNSGSEPSYLRNRDRLLKEALREAISGSHAEQSVDPALSKDIDRYRDRLNEAVKVLPHTGTQQNGWDAHIAGRIRKIEDFAKKDSITEADRTELKELIAKDLNPGTKGNIAGLLDWQSRQKTSEMRVSQDTKNPALYHVELPKSAYGDSWQVQVNKPGRNDVIVGIQDTGQSKVYTIDVGNQNGVPINFKAVQQGYYRDPCSGCYYQCELNSQSITLKQNSSSQTQIDDVTNRLNDLLKKSEPPVLAPDQYVEPSPYQTQPKPHIDSAPDNQKSPAGDQQDANGNILDQNSSQRTRVGGNTVDDGVSAGSSAPSRVGGNTVDDGATLNGRTNAPSVGGSTNTPRVGGNTAGEGVIDGSAPTQSRVGGNTTDDGTTLDGRTSAPGVGGNTNMPRVGGSTLDDNTTLDGRTNAPGVGGNTSVPKVGGNTTDSDTTLNGGTGAPGVGGSTNTPRVGGNTVDENVPDGSTSTQNRVGGNTTDGDTTLNGGTSAPGVGGSTNTPRVGGNTVDSSTSLNGKTSSPGVGGNTELTTLSLPVAPTKHNEQLLSQLKSQVEDTTKRKTGQGRTQRTVVEIKDMTAAVEIISELKQANVPLEKIAESIAKAPSRNMAELENAVFGEKILKTVENFDSKANGVLSVFSTYHGRSEVFKSLSPQEIRNVQAYLTSKDRDFLKEIDNAFSGDKRYYFDVVKKMYSDLNEDQKIALSASLLHLKETRSGSGEYTREGYKGSYIVQQKADGSKSLFYTGDSRVSMQTFVDGVWKSSENKPFRAEILEKAFDLRPVEGENTYTRAGYPGTYRIQADKDGSYSLHYSGGKYANGKVSSPQIFTSGRWQSEQQDSRAS